MKIRTKTASKKGLIQIGSVALLFLLAIPSANSTTLIRMSVAQMTHAAHLVVRASCLSNSSSWDAGEIWTFTSFAVEEIWKGGRKASSDSYISVRLLGGTAGALTSNVSGIPRFIAGEEVVLFLEPTARGDFSIVSWVQGTFRVRRDPHSNQQVAIQDTAAFDTFEPSTRQFRSTGVRNIPVEDLHSLVSAALSASANGAKGTK